MGMIRRPDFLVSGLRERLADLERQNECLRAELQDERDLRIDAQILLSKIGATWPVKNNLPS